MFLFRFFKFLFFLLSFFLLFPLPSGLTVEALLFDFGGGLLDPFFEFGMPFMTG